MAGAATFAGGILLADGLLLVCGKLIMVRTLLQGRGAVRLALLLCNGRMAVAARRSHGDRSGQRAAAEERQPDGQNHCNQFSGGV